MLHDFKLAKLIRKLNEKIDAKGYTLDDLVPILKDKDALFILFFLVLKALCNLCSVKPKPAEADSDEPAERACPKYRVDYVADKNYFLLKRFATSL